MAALKLIIRELAHRRVNFMLAVLAVMAASALYVAFEVTARAAQQETNRLMRDLGFNVRIIPKGTDMVAFWAAGHSVETMPESALQGFLEAEGFSYTHLVPMLHRRIQWRDMEALVTGMRPEVRPPDYQQQKPMSLASEEGLFRIEPGTAIIGSEIARSQGLAKGDVIDLMGRELTVAQVLAESGESDDIRIFGDLDDIQAALGLEGRINEIKALQCMCLLEGQPEDADPQALLAAELERLAPEGRVILLEGIYEARKEQRQMQERAAETTMAVVIALCGAAVGALAMLNVRDRRWEIGVLRAVGYGSGTIALLFEGRAVLVGLLGAVAGYYLGGYLAVALGPTVFQLTSKGIRPIPELFTLVTVAAPALAALASFIPAMIAVAQDPAVTLRDQ